MHMDEKELDINILDKREMDLFQKRVHHTGSFVAVFMATAFIFPSIAALTSALAYIAGWSPEALSGWLAMRHVGKPLADWLVILVGTPLLVGVVPTLIAWFLFALICPRFTAVHRVNVGSYDALFSRLMKLDALLTLLCKSDVTDTNEQSTCVTPSGKSAPSLNDLHTRMALKEALCWRDSVYDKLTKPSTAWVTGSGYIEVWRALNRGEEALLEVLPTSAVIGEALYDELCIQDSQITTHDELLVKLRRAVKVLDPSAVGYLNQPPPEMTSAVSTSDVGNETDQDDTIPAVGVEAEMQARTVLRTVRYTLNEFRSDNWQGVLRVRNHLITTTVFTGLAKSTVLELAIIALSQHTDGTLIIASVTGFYLVGALVGLFSRLYNESQSDKFIGDYRLANARLIAIPLFSGIAAVGGVLMVSNITHLVVISNFLSGLIVAAGFGLTPSLFINALQKQADQFKIDLKSVKPTHTSGDLRCP